jgi:IclR family transcriptional regulator, KDG regulon repressor
MFTIRPHVPKYEMMSESKTVGKALALLEAVAQKPGTLAEISRTAKLPRATVHRLLSTLAGLSYLRYDSVDRSFRLGFRLLELAHRAESQSELIRVARPWLDGLRDATDETAQLMIVDGDQGVYVDKAEPHRGFRFWTRIGMRRPLHAGASMRVLLAYLPEEHLATVLDNGPLRAFSHTTITDPKLLRAECKKIRLRGYCVSFEESHEGAAGVGAPIRDSSGRVIAGISVVGPRSRFTKRRLSLLIMETLKAATGVSQHLGFTGIGAASSPGSKL